MKSHIDTSHHVIILDVDFIVEYVF